MSWNLIPPDHQVIQIARLYSIQVAWAEEPEAQVTRRPSLEKHIHIHATPQDPGNTSESNLVVKIWHPLRDLSNSGISNNAFGRS